MVVAGLILLAYIGLIRMIACIAGANGKDTEE